VVANVGLGTSSTLATILVQHSVPFRRNPTSIEWSTLGIGISGVSFAAVTNIGPDQLGRVNSAIIVTSSSLTQFRPYLLQVNNSVNGFLAFSAEI